MNKRQRKKHDKQFKLWLEKEMQETFFRLNNPDKFPCGYMADLAMERTNQSDINKKIICLSTPNNAAAEELRKYLNTDGIRSYHITNTDIADKLRTKKESNPMLYVTANEEMAKKFCDDRIDSLRSKDDE